MKSAKFLFLLLALMIVFTFAGCDSNSEKTDNGDDKKSSQSSLTNEEKIIGKWLAEYNNEELAELCGTEVKSLEEKNIVDGMYFALEFKEDGTLYQNLEIDDESNVTEREYEFKDGVLYIMGKEQVHRFDGSDTLFIVFGNILEVEFKRVDEIRQPPKIDKLAHPEELIVGKWVAEFDYEDAINYFHIPPQEFGWDGVTELVVEFLDGNFYFGTLEDEGLVKLNYGFFDGVLYVDGKIMDFEFKDENTLSLELGEFVVKFDRR